MEIFKSGKTYDFMGRRLPFLGFSAILVVASFILLFTKGLSLGIDFSGGTLIQVKYTQAAPVQNIRDVLVTDQRFEKAVVTKFGSPSEIIIKIPTTTTALGKDVGDDIRNILKPTGEYEIRRVDMVGPKVERSVGFSINKEINNISNAEVKDTIKKKSSIPFGKGTTIIASIEKMNAINTYSFLKNISLSFIST
jgi:preprotein translocase subunit SecF